MEYVAYGIAKRSAIFIKSIRLASFPKCAKKSAAFFATAQKIFRISEKKEFDF